jgi:NADH-quinone oxidoreductase subunit M
MIQLTIWGPITKDENRELRDLSLREIAALVPLCVFMLWIGVAPETFLKPSREALARTLAEFNAGLERPAVAQATLRPTVMISEAGR